MFKTILYLQRLFRFMFHRLMFNICFHKLLFRTTTPIYFNNIIKLSFPTSSYPSNQLYLHSYTLKSYGYIIYRVTRTFVNNIYYINIYLYSSSDGNSFIPAQLTLGYIYIPRRLFTFINET